jgi:tetratricopeptide (TPR) repeat protein/predicted Ser/Thr protein kinase
LSSDLDNRGASDVSSSTALDSSVDGPKPVKERPRGFQLERGQAVNRYVVLYELGQGGMGVVYAAYDPELDRKVALKVLHADGVGSRSRTRLMREAKAIAKLTHPHVVAIHDVGTFQGRVFLAMEYVDGGTLRQWLREAPRSWRDVVAAMSAAGTGLAAAHAAGLVHRDFKPDNVLVDRGGRPVVLDFGLARRTGASEDRSVDPQPISRDTLPETGKQHELDIELTREGALLGTPAYMAPEQHLGQTTDARTDQFAFCVVLWEALYGSRPFRGETAATTAVHVVKGILDEPPRGSKVPTWVRRVLTRGLSVHPSQRWPDMNALIAALGRDPTRTRSRTAAIAIGALAVGGAVAWGMGLGRDNPCDGGEERLSGVWDDTRKGDVQRAFMSTRTPYAEYAFTTVEQQLDGYLRRWRDTRREACEATHVHREQSQDMLDLRMACLRARLHEVGSLTNEFARADAAVVEHAVEAVSVLGRLEQCSETGVMASRLREPESETTRRQIAELRDRLSDAKAKEYAGRYDAALAVAQAVMTDAAELSWPPMAAEARLRLGSIRERKGDFAGAERDLLESIWVADASHHDGIAAEAWVKLVWVSGVELSKLEPGQTWGRFAQAAIDRAGGDELLQATLRHNIGGVLYRQGRLDEALGAYREALVVQQRLLGTEDPTVAMTLNHIGNVYIVQGRLDDARDYCLRSLDLRKRTLGERHPKVAASLNNLAEIARGAGDAAKALALAHESLAITGGSGIAEEIVALTIAGATARALADLDASATALERLLELRERTGEGGPIAEALRSLAEVRFEAGAFDEAVELWQRAVVLDRSKRPREAVWDLLGLARALTARGSKADAALAEAATIVATVQPRDAGLEQQVAEARAKLGGD